MKPMSPKKMAWWEKQRAKGKWPWIWKTAIYWGMCVIIFVYLTGFLYREENAFNWFSIPIYILGGVFVGWVGWTGNEGRYQSSLLEKKTQEYSE